MAGEAETIIPSYGTKLNGNVDATEQELEYTSRVLQLQYVAAGC